LASAAGDERMDEQVSWSSQAFRCGKNIKIVNKFLQW
jgi:hypothetical protein